jgi:hypothetical protein
MATCGTPDAILGNLRRQMNERHERAEHLAGDAKLAHTDHLRKLAETLRDYAKDVRAVYGAVIDWLIGCCTSPRTSQ